MNKILLVEDDLNMGMLLKENLKLKGFDTTWCRNGVEGYDAFLQNGFDLCILDIMLPLKDGFTLSQEIKKKNADIPLIFLTARGTDGDKVRGFELGCDDYVTKPFSTRELCFRINAVLKRANKSQTHTSAAPMALGQFIFDYNRMTLGYGNDTVKLSAKESELLYILLSHKDELVERGRILEKVWGSDDYFAAKSMDVYISKIRKLLRNDDRIEILNAYGIGFKLTVKEKAPI